MRSTFHDREGRAEGVASAITASMGLAGVPRAAQRRSQLGEQGPTSAGRRRGGRKFALAKAQVRLAEAAMAHRDTSVSALCQGSASGR